MSLSHKHTQRQLAIVSQEKSLKQQTKDFEDKHLE